MGPSAGLTGKFISHSSLKAITPAALFSASVGKVGSGKP